MAGVGKDRVGEAHTPLTIFHIFVPYYVPPTPAMVPPVAGFFVHVGNVADLSLSSSAGSFEKQLNPLDLHARSPRSVSSSIDCNPHPIPERPYSHRFKLHAPRNRAPPVHAPNTRRPTAFVERHSGSCPDPNSRHPLPEGKV